MDALIGFFAVKRFFIVGLHHRGFFWVSEVSCDSNQDRRNRTIAFDACSGNPDIFKYVYPFQALRLSSRESP